MPKPVLNPDGSVTYWSVRETRWVDHARHVPGYELTRLPGQWREQVEQHLSSAKRRREGVEDGG